ncbi:MAG: hypothetical protein U0263_36590 [Polyangiaceae bacterium]
MHRTSRSSPAYLAMVAALVAGCEQRSAEPGPVASTASSTATAPERAPSSGATASAVEAPPPKKQEADVWLRVAKAGRDLGVIEVLAGKPWRFVRHSQSEDARAVEKIVSDHGAAPIALHMHLPADKPGERGPYGTQAIGPGDPLYRHAIEDHLERKGFDVDDRMPRFADTNAPASVKKLEFSRDGAKVGTLDLTVTPAKLELVNREGNALFLESFWKNLDTEDELIVSYVSSSGGKEALTSVSAKKGSPGYARLVRLAFAVRYPAYTMVVTP